MSVIRELHERAGQSVWLDFIRRDVLTNGRLQHLIDEGVRGLTSNPTIFQKAIAGTELYDSSIVADVDAEPATIFERIAIEDIGAAADLMRPVYEAANGHDGLVSLEVSPHLAYDTEGTIADAERLWAAVDRPNVMIKVPATLDGVPALEELIASGINVNATLMFSLDHYEAIAMAFVRGVERAADPRRIASVASFFVSRVDSKADAALEKVGTDEAQALLGRIAVANAKLAYDRYREIFLGSAFAAAAARGASPQRVLWASTSTKNPAYRDVLYVEELVGPSTVNTMPPDTIDAFRDHGVIDPDALITDVAEARAEVDSLAELGIDIDTLTEELQTEGVSAFADSFDDLLSAIAAKRSELVG
jgi:transaldolase